MFSDQPEATAPPSYNALAPSYGTAAQQATINTAPQSVHPLNTYPSAPPVNPNGGFQRHSALPPHQPQADDCPGALLHAASTDALRVSAELALPLPAPQANAFSRIDFKYAIPKYRATFQFFDPYAISAYFNNFEYVSFLQGRLTRKEFEQRQKRIDEILEDKKWKKSSKLCLLLLIIAAVIVYITLPPKVAESGTGKAVIYVISAVCAVIFCLLSLQVRRSTLDALATITGELNKVDNRVGINWRYRYESHLNLWLLVIEELYFLEIEAF